MARRRPHSILAVAVLLLGSWGVYRLLAGLVEFGPGSEGRGWLLPLLSLALVVLTLGLAGVLIRNLVQLIVESKRGVLGARLRIKLVFFFLALVLVPAFVLFYGSARVISRTVDAILRTPLERLTSGGEVVGPWAEYFEAQSVRRARELAEEIASGRLLEPERREQLGQLLDGERRRGEMHQIRVLVAGRMLAASDGPLAEDPLPQRVARASDLARQVAEAAAPVSRIGAIEHRLLAEAAVPVPGASEPTAVVVGSLLPERIAGSARTIDAAVRDYKRFRAQRRELVRFYVTLIGLIFLATLFLATWIGFYLSRRITEPIREVAAAAREIAAGNLDVRVATRAGDETSVLVDAFNEMAAQLQENREVITRSTAELRRSNRALDDRRRTIETLVANLSTAVVSLDPQGRVTTSNPAVERVLGLRLAVGEELAPQLRRHQLEPLARLIESVDGAVGAWHRDLELGDAAPVPHVSLRVSPLGGRSGEGFGTLIMVEDLTDVLRAHKAQAWQEVARRIAHEIKNPLTPIQLAAQRLRKKFFARADDLDDVLLEATASIEHEVGGLKQLVDEFSQYARMPEVRPEPVELGKLVESVVSLYRGLPDVRWQLQLDAGSQVVRVDPRQMRRVLMNLIDNALAATEGRGEIRIAARAQGAGGRLRIEVADDGPGIPSSDRDKLFVPYFSTKRRGTGLGLAIVHKVVTDHRGTIRVEDNSPRGARFVIDIPA